MFNFSQWFSGFPPQMATFLIASLPISELRGALPLAYTVYALPLWSSFLWSFLGNTCSVALVLAFLEPVSRFLMQHSRIFKRFFNWLFERTRRKHSKRFERWGALALITFVAIPLPITGGWTGSVAAFVFGIPYRKALPLIVLGILISGLIVSLLTWGGVQGINKFF